MAGGRDILDGFDRRVPPDIFEIHNWDNWEKLNADDKRKLLAALKEKISNLQVKINEARKSKAQNLNDLCLSQMMLMWMADQIQYGKL